MQGLAFHVLTVQPQTCDLDMQTLQDLDLTTLVSTVIPGGKPEQILAWFQTYLTDDVSELEQRSSFLCALLPLSDVPAQLQRIGRQRQRLHDTLARTGRDEPLLLSCTYSYHSLKLFLESLQAVSDFFSQSKALSETEVGRSFQAFLTGSAVEAQRKLYQRLTQVFSPPAGAVLGVNVAADYSATMFGLVGATEKVLPAAGLFDLDSVQMDSFLGYSPVPRTTQLEVLERRLYKTLEKQWHASLSKASTILRELDRGLLHRWLSSLEELDFFLSGWRLAKRFASAGSPLCAAAAERKNGLAVEHLFNPLLLLSGTNATSPISLSFRDGEVVFLSGINRSGRTSCLKAAAQAMLLAQLGYLVPAERMEYSPKRRFRTLFASGESADLTQSRFQRDIDLYWQIQRQADPLTLVLCNEPFNSTNFEEALQISQEAVLRMSQRNATVLLVTNLQELYGVLQQEPTIRLRHYTANAERQGDKTIYSIEEKPPDVLAYVHLVLQQYHVAVEDLVQNVEEQLAIHSCIEEVLTCSGCSRPH